MNFKLIDLVDCRFYYSNVNKNFQKYKFYFPFPTISNYLYTIYIHTFNILFQYLNHIYNIFKIHKNLESEIEIILLFFYYIKFDIFIMNHFSKYDNSIDNDNYYYHNFIMVK